MIPKFRVWNKKHKQLAKVTYLDFRDKRVFCKDFLDESVLAFVVMWDFEDVILMQSTGLKDKNGKEIFEGDIFTNGIDVMSMKRHDTLGFYIDFKGKIEFLADGADLEEFEEDAKEIANGIKILGNIYENPELLEV